MLICDEVQTGLGRTGAVLACDHDGIRPDGLVLGKALGGGLLPVSAFVATEELMSVFAPGDHGSTFGGNPLAAAVGEAALALLLRDKLSEKARVRGDELIDKLRAIDHPAIAEVRGKGLLIGVEIEPSFASARPCLRRAARARRAEQGHARHGGALRAAADRRERAHRPRGRGAGRHAGLALRRARASRQRNANWKATPTKTAKPIQ